MNNIVPYNITVNLKANKTYLGFSRLARDHDDCPLSFRTAVSVEVFSTLVLQQYPVIFQQKNNTKCNI